MNHHETNPEEVLDRVLTGLRAASPPEGMDRRILRTLEHRATAPRRWPFEAPMTWAVTITSVATVALAVSIATHRSHQAAPQIAEFPRPLVLANKSVQKANALLVRSTQQTPHRVIQGYIARKAVPAPEPINTEDALALSEARAPSQPAPPMPLTEQEKLLLRLIHKGDPVELAMLDPKFRSSEEANSRADFDRFFAPPPLPDIKPEKLDIKSNLGDKK